MAWTTPRTWVTGEFVTASIMNTHVRDNLNYLNSTLDYSSGTFTPTLAFATNGDAVFNYTEQFGKYNKFGTLVLLTARVVCSTYTQTTASGILFVNGMPFANAQPEDAFGGSVIWRGITAAGYTNVAVAIQNGQSRLYLELSGSGKANVQVQPTHMPSGGLVHFSCSINYMAVQ